MPVPAKSAKKKTPTSDRKIVYPRYQVLIHCCPTPDAETGEMVEYEGPITVKLAKQLLGWETDDEYVRRRMTEDPSLKETKLRATDHLLKDRHGNKVRCSNNTINRPFDLTHAKKLGQDILSKKYEMNMEDIIIGRTGLVLSGQHRLVGLVLAFEQWELQEHWKKKWPEEPYIESVVAVGCREDQSVLQTFDNVKPRSLSDTIYTSPLFATKSASDKKRCSVMVDQGVDWLWRRLDATSGKFVEHQTHSASLDFLDRHKKLVAAVKHIHDLDGSEEGVTLSALGLNAGRCAAMCYLMGCSGTTEEDADQYHLAGSPKKETQLDWKLWDRALKFWEDVARGRRVGSRKTEAGKDEDVYALPPWVEELRKALANLNDENLTGRVTDAEKAAVVALAWAEYSQGNEDFECGEPGAENSIVPETEVNPNNNTRYIPDEPVFGFADRGSGKKGVDKDPDPTPEEIEALKEAEKKRRADELAAKVAAANGKGSKSQTTIAADPAKKVTPVPSPKTPGSLNGHGKPAPTPPKKTPPAPKKGKAPAVAAVEEKEDVFDLTEGEHEEFVEE